MGTRKKSKGKRKLVHAQCYLCGRICENPTIDHVPAWNLAPNAPQSQFIQLSACKECNCNNRYNIQESRFRDYVANVAQGRGNVSAASAFEKFSRRAKEEYVRIGRPNRDLQRIIDNSGLAIHITVDGKFLGTSTHLNLDSEFYVNEIFVKIARGIHYYHTKAVLPAGHHAYVHIINQFQFIDYVHSLQNLYYGKRGDFCEYIGSYEQDTPICGIWAISIYACVCAVVSFEKENRPIKILRSLLDFKQPSLRSGENTNSHLADLGA